MALGTPPLAWFYTAAWPVFTPPLTIKRYIHFRDQIEWISSPGKDRKILMNFVGRYERFQDDYTEICNLLGLSPPTMPSERKSTHGQDYRAVYTSKMVDIVDNIYKVDIAAFGYEFE
jgi:hypothetical protein